MTDEDHAAAIDKAVSSLNEAISASIRDGLEVDAQVIEATSISERRPVFDVRLSRPIKVGQN
jgi:hypothetical protein